MLNSHKVTTFSLTLTIVLLIKTIIILSKGNLLPLGVISLVFIIYAIVFQRTWLKGLFISPEPLELTRYELIFGLIIRTFLLLILYAILLNNNVTPDIRQKLYGWNPEMNNIIVTIAVVVLFKIFESIISIGFIFKRFSRMYGFWIGSIISLTILAFMRGFNLIVIIPIVYVFFQQYLFFKTKDLRLTVISKIFTGTLYLFSNYFHIYKKDESWVLVVFFISIIAEFLILNFYYNRMLIDRNSSIEVQI